MNRRSSRARRISAFLACILPGGLLLSSAGCSTEVDLFTDSEKTYSVYGFVDTAADSHWIRVEYLQDSLLTSGGPISATATLEHLETGTRETLRGRLHPIFPAASTYIYASGTAIQPGQSYRLVISGEKGEAQATAVVPDVFPDPTFFATPRILRVCPPNYQPLPTEVQIRGIARVVDVEVEYTTTGGRWEVDYTGETLRFNGGYRAKIAWARDVGSVCPAHLIGMRVRVSSGSPDWPQDARIDDETQLPEESVSNVQGGVGYFGGVVTREFEIPIER